MAKKIKKYRVAVDSETYAISLVDQPAMEETLVALEKQKEIQVKLANEEKHMVYSAVLIPDKPIYRRNEDGDEFYVEFTKESIEKMSQQFFKDYRQDAITLDHETNASDITVVESWIKTDMFKDKSVALGLNESLPIGTWFCGMKVNQIDAWERIKNHELNGFSVESLLRLEEFSKEDKNENNMNIETNEMFWDKLKNILKDAFSKKEELAANSGFTNVEDYEKEVEAIKEELAEETPAEPVAEPTPAPEPTPEPEPKVEEPKPEPTPEPEPKVEEPKAEEPKPQPQDNHLEELVNSLKEEIAALKEMNNGLQEKIKDLGKQPSATPVNTNAKPSTADNYSAWREKMRSYIG